MIFFFGFTQGWFPEIWFKPLLNWSGFFYGQMLNFTFLKQIIK